MYCLVCLSLMLFPFCVSFETGMSLNDSKYHDRGFYWPWAVTSSVPSWRELGRPFWLGLVVFRRGRRSKERSKGQGLTGKVRSTREAPTPLQSLVWVWSSPLFLPSLQSPDSRRPRPRTLNKTVNVSLFFLRSSYCISHSYFNTCFLLLSLEYRNTRSRYIHLQQEQLTSRRLA